MKTEPKPSGVYPVFCQTPAVHCIDIVILLGYAPMNTPIRCPFCGRLSIAQRNEIKKPSKTAQITL